MTVLTCLRLQESRRQRNEKEDKTRKYTSVTKKTPQIMYDTFFSERMRFEEMHISIMNVDIDFNSKNHRNKKRS